MKSFRPLLHILTFVLTATIVVLGAHRTAHAQNVTIINEATLPRLNAQGQQISKRSLNLTPEAVNLQDCIDDQQIQFPITLSGFAVNSSVQVWASNGGDCKTEQNRNSANAVCWRVLDTEIPLIQQQTVNIPVRRMMAGVPPFKAINADETFRTVGAGLCGKVNLSTISIQFLYFNAGEQANAASSKNVSVSVDTVGPEPPSGLSTLPGDTRIQVKWASISGGGGSTTTGDASTSSSSSTSSGSTSSSTSGSGSTSSGGGTTGGLVELTGIKVYCALAGTVTKVTPNPPTNCRDVVVEAGTEEPTDAGDAGDADAGTGTGGNGDGTTTIQVCDDAGSTESQVEECSNENFNIPDGGAAFDEAGTLYPTTQFNTLFQCGEIVGNSGTSINATSVNGKPLENFKLYAVAVAATDKLGNIGKLSAVECQTPEPTTDFWDDYKGAGGKAGGCTTVGDAAGVPIGSLMIIGFIAMMIKRSTARAKTKTTTTTTKQKPEMAGGEGEQR